MRQFNKSNHLKGKITMTIKKVLIYEDIEHWRFGSC